MTASIKGALKPCPFCGGAPRSKWHGAAGEDDDSGYWGIDCCQAFAHADDEQSATRMWNTRATPASLSCGEARERIARIAASFDWPVAPKDERERWIEENWQKHIPLADAILATGCVPDEASIRDKREKIARMIRRAMIDNPTGGTSEERAAKRASIADEYATAYLADLATGCVPGEAAIRADQIIMPRALVEQAHAAMLETGWHLAPAHATPGDGVIEAAVAEIEERFAAAIRAGRGE